MRPAEHYLPKDLIEMLKRQHYYLFGHSAVKTCHWTKMALTNNQYCYKSKFYGIASHRCVQMTPAVGWCQQQCRFCWRPLTNLGFELKEYDPPEEIVEESFKGQKILLSGFGALKEQIGEKKLAEAAAPKHVAISLSGEPTIYPKLSELIDTYHKLGLTTFLVSNGMRPEVLEKISMPTQLYISVEAPNKEMHKKINAPLIKDSWERLNKTLELLPSLNTRKVIRLTAMEGINMSNEEEFAKLIEKADPDFVEVKSYMFIGYSRKRLEEKNMPSHDSVKEFAERINKYLNYISLDESVPSRVVLLSKKKDSKIDFGD